MSNWMTSVMSIGKAALEKISAPADPNQVKVVNTTEFVPIPTMNRYLLSDNFSAFHIRCIILSIQ